MKSCCFKVRLPNYLKSHKTWEWPLSVRLNVLSNLVSFLRQCPKMDVEGTLEKEGKTYILPQIFLSSSTLWFRNFLSQSWCFVFKNSWWISLLVTFPVFSRKRQGRKNECSFHFLTFISEKNIGPIPQSQK